LAEEKLTLQNIICAVSFCTTEQVFHPELQMKIIRNPGLLLSYL